MSVHADRDTARGESEGGPSRALVTGYTIVLPAGWRRIPARAGTDKAIKGILDEVFGKLSKDLPRDKVMPHRRELERRLAKMIRQARQKAAIDLYLPIEYIHGMPVPASFIVSQGALSGAGPGDPTQVVAYLAAQSDDASPITVDGAVGVRSERATGPDPATEIDVGSRRADYVLAVPGAPDSWLMIAFSTLGSGDPDGPYARILVELFDAMMTTFRWTRADGAVASAAGI